MSVSVRLSCKRTLLFATTLLLKLQKLKNQMSHLLPFPKANFRKRFAYGNSSYLLTLRFSYIKLFLCYKNFFPDQLCFTKLTFLLLTFFTNIDLCSLIGRLLLFLILSLAHITMAVLGSVCLEAGQATRKNRRIAFDFKLKKQHQTSNFY